MAEVFVSVFFLCFIKKKFKVVFCYSYCCLVKLCLTLWDPMDYSPPGSSSMGFPRQEY